MSDIIKLGKKIFTVGVVATTIFWSVGVATLVPAVANAADSSCPTLVAGDMIKVSGKAAIYALNNDLKVLYFPSGDEFKSWRPTYGGYKTITQACYDSLSVPSAYPAAVNYRPGSYVVRRPSSDQLYVVEPGNTLAKITVAAAKALYGTNYKVMTVQDVFWPHYINRATDVTEAKAVPGMTVKNGGVTYYVNSDNTLSTVSAEGLTANGFQTKFVYNVADSVVAGLTAGTAIAAEVKALTDKVQSGGVVAVAPGTTPVTPVVANGSLVVALAADTPAATNMIVSDTATDSADSAARAPLAKINFTATGGEAKVKTIKLKQTGISGTTDVSSLYLYDGDKFIGSHNSLNEKVFTFTNGSGLFTVPAGQTKTISVLADMADNMDSGKSVGVQLIANTDVELLGTGTVSLNGSVNGNLMTYVAVTDGGYAQITNVSPTADNTVNPGTTNFSVWTFQIQGGDQILKLNRIKFSEAGSVSKTDLTNLKLYDGGVQIGTTVATMADDLTVEFKDLNLAMEKGGAKSLELRADVASGSSRTFRFMIQNVYDIDITDTSYGNLIQPDNATEATWAVRYQGNASTVETTVNSGTMTVSVSPTTPTGNVAQGATQVELAKYDFKATGEDIKVNDIYFKVNSSGNEVGMDNVAMFLDGSQIGTTQDLAADNTAVQWTFGSSFIVAAGQTKTLTVKGDIKNAASTNLTSGSQLTPTLDSTAGTATAQTSLSAISLSSSVDASVRTVSSGTLSVAKNGAVTDATAANPTGVTNQTDLRIASFQVTAGSAEGVTLNQLVIGDDGAGTYQLGDVFYNLYVKVNGTKVGDTQGTLTAAGETNTYTFSPSPAIDVAAGSNATIDVYASVLSGTSITTAEAVCELYSVSYYKKVSKSSATWTTTQDGQKVYIAANGTLTVDYSADNYPSQIVAAGTVGTDRVALAKFYMTASNEDVNVESIIIFDGMVTQGAIPAQATSTLSNFGLYVDGSATPLNGLEVNLTATNTPATNSGYAVFNISPVLVVPKGQTKTIVVKALPNEYSSASNGMSHVIILDSAVESLNSQTGSILARGAKSNVAINAPSADKTAKTIVYYRAKPTVTKNNLASTKMTSGSTVALADLTITASPTQASLKKITFNVSVTDTTTTSGILTLDDFALYNGATLLTAGTDVVLLDGSGTAAADRLDTAGTGCITTDSFGLGCSATNVDTTGTSTIVAVFANEIKIPTTGLNLVLKARVTNISGTSTDNDSVTVELANDDTLPGGGTVVTTAFGLYYLDTLPTTFYGGTNGYVVALNTAAAGAGTEYNGHFIWSDESTGVSHTFSTITDVAGSITQAYASSEQQDWTAGYLVGNLNTGLSWSLNK